MAPLSWDKLMDVSVSDIDEDQADDWFNKLTKFDPDAETDSDRLCQLFRVTQAIMNVKSDQADELMGEMETQAKVEGKTGAKKEQELAARVEELEAELRQLKRYGGDEGGGGGVGARALREELKDIESQNDMYQKEIKDLQRDLADEKRATERYSSRIAELERELNELRRDNDQMRQDISDYKSQLQFQRDNQTIRRTEDTEHREKLTRKNRDLAEAMEELQNLTDANEDLQKKSEELQHKLEEAITEMDRNSDDYVKLKMVLQQSDAVTDKLRDENMQLKSQVEDLNDRVQVKTDADSEIWVAVNNKVEEWKKLLGEKDNEVLGYQDEIFQLRKQLIAANMDTDKASVAALSKVVQEKDLQIQGLTDQLDSVTNDMETNVAIIEDLRTELNKTGAGPSDRLQKRLRELQGTLKFHEGQLKEADVRVQQADTDASNKDKELSEALERMRQYEAGEYGLAEAVAEIKDRKNQIKVRDRQIEELTQHVNKCEMKINDLCDENEDLRDKLGLDHQKPLDLTEFRKNKEVKREEAKALNIILQREVERLEEERLELKQKLRKLAQQTGQRAVALGLTAEDMLAIQDFTEDLKFGKTTPAGVNEMMTMSHIAGVSSSAPPQRRLQERTDDLRMRNEELDEDVVRHIRDLDRLHKENVDVKTRMTQLQEENNGLQQGLREVLESLKEQQISPEKGGNIVIQCPTLERMLAAIESKQLVGSYDTSLYLKAQVDNLQGRNEELRTALKEARHDANKAQTDLNKVSEKADRLAEDNAALKQSGTGGGLFQAIPLPEGIAVTSSEVISSLNEHLVVTLQELTLKEEMISKTEGSLENYKRKFAVMRHQQGLLYQDHLKQKKEYDDETERLEQLLKTVQGEREEDKVRLQEYDRLLDSLSQDEVEVRRRLSEMARRVTVLRVNEKALTRRYQTMEEVEGTLRKDVTKLKNDMIAIETAVAERLGYLQRHKDMANFKIASLQRAMDESVPSQDLEQANKEYHSITEKYRDILEKGNSLVEKTEALVGLEGELKRLTESLEEVKKELELEKERRYALEAAMEKLHKSGVAEGTEVSDREIISISKKLTTLEMKELNERQRAEHASRMYEQGKKLTHDLEERNMELESKFAEVTRMNLEAQKTERELRDELTECVTKAVSDADRKRITEFEASDVKLRDEVNKLKEIADVASSQVTTLESQQVSRDKEVMSLRQQLLDFQVQSDEKTVIGKLHRHIVQLQVSEGTAVRKFEEATKSIRKLEACNLRLERRLDEKDQTIYHNRVEAHNKMKQLKRSLQELRRQFAGAIPLSKQEKFAVAMAQIQEDKGAIEKELKEVKNQRNSVEDKLAGLELQHGSLQELLATLKDGRGAQKVLEWHGKMDGLRLEELRQKRQIARLQQHIKYLDGVIRTHEVTIADLEADNVKLAKDSESRELHWEQREVELERTIQNMEKQASDIACAAAKFEQAVGALPDDNLPVAGQLEQAIATIKGNVKVILDTKAENKVFKKKVIELEKAVRESEHLVISRDRLISELRLRMPATAERDEIIRKVTSKVTEGMQHRTMDMGHESEQALKVAQDTMASLQARIASKEETIQKYQDLLSQARDDMMKMNQKHEEELRVMQQKIHLNTDIAFSKFKDAAQQMLNKQPVKGITTKQLRHLNELEDQVAEQENSLIAMTTKVQQKEEEVTKMRLRIQQVARQLKEEKDKLQHSHNSTVASMQVVIEEYKSQMDGMKKEAELLNDEIGTLKEVNNRAPTTTMKNLVERLKNQLALKEKQQQALSKALTELRADMVTQAQEAVRVRSDTNQAEVNVQHIVDKHTKALHEQLDELQTQNERLKRDTKKRRDNEAAMHSELDDNKVELSRNESSISKLKGDKHRLEHEIEELEKRIDRMNAAIRVQKSDTDASSKRGLERDLEENRRRVRLLEEELKRKQQQPEKPYERDSKVRDKPDDVSKWEENKKLQRVVEKLKTRLKEREQEFEKLHRNTEMLKAALERAQRDKESIETRVHKAASAPLLKASVPAAYKPDHDIEAVKHDNYQLHEQVNHLQRQIMKEKDGTYEELRLKNHQLMDRIQHLEQTLQPHTAATSSNVLQDGSSSSSSRAYQELYEKYQDLQKQVLRLSEENLEMRFDLEQAKKDSPRLKERIDGLQHYVDALKKENAELGGSTSVRSSIDSTSSLRKVGESGRGNRELEKTIGMLKKVIERVQSENEQLKKAPGVVSNEQTTVLKRENQGLKSQLEDLRQKVGAELSERYTTQQKGTAKMMSDYDKLRKDLMKEMENNEKLRIHVKNAELQKSQVSKELMDMRGRLDIEEAKRPSVNGGDNKGWKSAVITRMYEDKLKGLQEELDKKTKQIKDMKLLVQQATEHEQSLLEENHRLMEKISILEHFPPGSKMSDTDVMKEYQHSRLMVERLKNEKQELLAEVMHLKGTDSQQPTDDIISKASGYDRVMRESIETKMEMKSIALERDKLSKEVDKLRKELGNFGPEFFEEIEDLKYNYRESVKKNVLYEERLHQLGIRIDSPNT